jgi:hypothetical protein
VQGAREMVSRWLGRLGALARSGRGYLAGFGTSGSLLAGAALMFVVASALVAFKGWPHVSAQPSPREVVVSPRAAATAGSPVARRLALISAAPVRAGGGAAGGVRPRGGTAAPRAVNRRALGRPAVISRPVVGAPTRTGSAPPSSGAPAPTGSNPVPISGVPVQIPVPVRVPPVPVPPAPVPPVPSPAPVQQVIKQTTGALGGVLSSAGNQAGSLVQQTTGAVGAAVHPLSPQVAGAVGSVGSGASKTATGVTNTIAGTLSGLGGN